MGLTTESTAHTQCTQFTELCALEQRRRVPHGRVRDVDSDQPCFTRCGQTSVIRVRMVNQYRKYNVLDEENRATNLNLKWFLDIREHVARGATLRTCVLDTSRSSSIKPPALDDVIIAQSGSPKAVCDTSRRQRRASGVRASPMFTACMGVCAGRHEKKQADQEVLLQSTLRLH
jgi:hypothetical protein